jgi:predicted RNA binding protein YcfA (HicA-like mRNA interferase family)
MNRSEFVKILKDKGVVFNGHGSRHDIFIHRKTGKKIPIPRHTEIKNKTAEYILEEIPE